MNRLTATFPEVFMPERLHFRNSAEVPDWEPGTHSDLKLGPYHVAIEGFDIDLTFVMEWIVQATKGQAYRPVRHAIVVVSHSETQIPPLPARTPEGHRDFHEVTEYFSGRTRRYIDAAREACQRLLSKCKYELFIPLETVFPTSGLANPEWTDDEGRMYESGIVFAQGEFRMVHEDHAIDLQSPSWISESLQSECVPELHIRILSDAYVAWRMGQLRRALVEAASACEIAVKAKLHGGGGPSALVFEYLEDMGGIRVTVPELVSRVCERVFGRNLKKDQPIDYGNVDLLFRARNKAVHRGALECRNDSGQLIVVDSACVLSWLSSVKTLVRWLESL